MMRSGTTFDYATTRFAHDDACDLRFARDPRKHKPTRHELGVLVTYPELVADPFNTCIALWGAGTIVAPEGLSKDEQPALSRHLDFIGQAINGAASELIRSSDKRAR